MRFLAFISDFFNFKFTWFALSVSNTGKLAMICSWNKSLSFLSEYKASEIIKFAFKTKIFQVQLVICRFCSRCHGDNISKINNLCKRCSLKIKRELVIVAGCRLDRNYNSLNA